MANSTSKQSNGHPFWTTLGVIFLILIVLAGITALSGYFLGWFDKSEDETEETLVDDGEIEEGSRDDSSENLAFGISTYSIDPMFYDTYSIDPDCESAYLLTANLNGTAFDPRVDWYITWDSSYTGSDDVQDFVALDYDSNLSLEATLTCYQPFGTAIWVVAYRTAFPDVFVKCQLDYFASAGSIVSAEFNEETLSIDVFHEDTFGVGTIKGTFEFNDDLKIVADEETISCIADLLSDNFSSYLYEFVFTTPTSYFYLSGTFEDVLYYFGFDFLYSDDQLNNLDFSSFIESLCSYVCYLTQVQPNINKGTYSDLDNPRFVSTLSDYFESSGGVFPEFSLTQLCFGENVWSEPTDLYYVFSQQDWDFAVQGSLTYSTSIGNFNVPFETRVLVSGGSFEIIGDDATLSLDSSSLVFGI